jgi:diketogulonate reductase-like aldo/keto reductase
MKFSSFLYLSCILVAIDRPVECLSEGIFGKLMRFATGGGDLKRDKKTKRGVHKRHRNHHHHSYSEDFPTTKLNNGVHFPLVGMGVGNMNPHVVPAIISHGLKDDRNIRLIDTAHISQNEFLVAQGIIDGADKLTKEPDGGEKVEVHVTTKIWYTHLGYERTHLAVKESLRNFQEAIDHPNVDLKLHVLLHWPRCYDEIPWMDCSGEEERLPEEVKQTGKAPHLDSQDAWKGSWKALEEVLADHSNPVAGIGVSNFHRKELEELASIAKVLPQIAEIDTWSLLYDPLLIEFCHKQGIHIVAYHLIQGVLSKSAETPFATHHLLSVANDISKDMRSKGLLSNDTEDNNDITAAQVILAWLVQHSISVIPRTTDLYHLRENSASALMEIPPMDDSTVQVVAESVEALISGEDLTEDAFVTLTFHAKSKDVFLYWHDPEFGGEIEVAKIQKGKSFEESSHPGHQFKIYYDDGSGEIGNDGSLMELFTVSGNYGDSRHIDL